jgi:hypothetical protein
LTPFPPVSATALGIGPRITCAGLSFSTTTAMQTVATGPFTFMTEAQLDQIRIKFASSTPSYDRALAGASVNGESFTFTHSGATYQREEFASLLQDAYLQIGVTKWGLPRGNRTVAFLGAPQTRIGVGCFGPC